MGWPAGLQFQRGPKLFVRGAQVFFFFLLKINLLKKIYILGQRGWGPPVSIPSPAKPKGKQKKTRLITIQQYKSQSTKTPDGKLKNKDELY